VALSRGRHDARTYTDDRERLPAVLNRPISTSVRTAIDRRSELSRSSPIDADHNPEEGNSCGLGVRSTVVLVV